MANQKTSKKQKNSFILNGKNIPFVKVKKGVKTYAWSPTADLLDEGLLAAALFDCLKEGDIDAFKEILSGHLNAKVKTRLAKEHNLSARTMFEALSKDGNPRLTTISKLIKLACAS